jgi:predicted phage gp36 major capsid-like protein
MDIDINDRNDGGALSVKAACATPDAVVTHAELMRAFEAYKAENDDSLKEIARKGVADVVSSEKLARSRRSRCATPVRPSTASAGARRRSA